MPASVSASPLPPPGLSTDRVDRMLAVLETAAPGGEPRPHGPGLAGREALVPAFGTSVAFFEGELRPGTRPAAGQGGSSSKSNDGKSNDGNGNDSSNSNDSNSNDGNDNDNDNDEEMVFVSTGSTKPKGNSRSSQKQRDPRTPPEGDLVAVGLPEALEWLRKHSSSGGPPQAPGSATTPPAPGPHAAKKQQKQSKPMPMPKQEQQKKQQQQQQQQQPPGAPPVPPPSMFNINEEYDASGKRVFGEAVDLSSRLRAVYGESAAPAPAPGEGDRQGSSNDSAGQGTPPGTRPKTPVVSDEEYDRIARRLEELERLEEEDAKRSKKVRSKALGGSPKSSSSSSSSSFGFKKGFLNASPKKPSGAKAKAKAKAKPKAAENPSGIGTAPPPNPSPPPSGGGGVTIDTSKNRIHQIPREGRQQPVPQRSAPRQQQQQQQQQPPPPQVLPSAPTRLLDSSVFSGHVSERPSPISPDTAARLAANEQTRSLQHELREQKPAPKRVSRFRQQREQEQQQQQPRRVSRFKQQRQQG